MLKIIVLTFRNHIGMILKNRLIFAVKITPKIKAIPVQM